MREGPAVAPCAAVAVSSSALTFTVMSLNFSLTAVLNAVTSAFSIDGVVLTFARSGSFWFKFFCKAFSGSAMPGNASFVAMGTPPAA